MEWSLVHAPRRSSLSKMQRKSMSCSFCRSLFLIINSEHYFGARTVFFIGHTRTLKDFFSIRVFDDHTKLVFHDLISYSANFRLHTNLVV
jgi:hypothetical protein